MAEKFKVGDVVQLKSGGPSMTVRMVRPIEADPPYAYVYMTYWNSEKQAFVEADFSSLLLRSLEGVL